MIEKSVIDEILQRADIKTVISPYVTLQRSGTNMKGLCPFHSEKTPSFTVFPQDNSFYCFGCGVGGNAISFIRKAENLDYFEAAKYVGKMVGVNVPDEYDQSYGGVKVDKNRIYEINRTTAKLYYSVLMSKHPDSMVGYEYLSKKRNLSDSTIKHFGLGFAPKSFNFLKDTLLKKGYTEEELLAAGVVTRTSKGYLRDTFMNRVIYPIIDLTGNVIAFGGRVMDDSKPKYLNTSDTPVFNKRRNLFALNFAKEACKETLILCEGYMDVISVHQGGFTNAVATLGTSITPEHARLMKRYTKEVIISYDMDEAGRLAADKAMKMLEEVGLTVRLLKLTGAKDPDEFIKANGKDAFKRALDASASKIDYKLNQVLNKYHIEDPQEKIEAINELIVIVSEVYSEAEREVYLKVISEKLDIDINALRADLKKALQRKIRNEKKKETQDVKNQSFGLSDRINPDYVRIPEIARCEESILGILLLYPMEYHSLLLNGQLNLTTNDFKTGLGKRFFDSYYLSSNGTIDEAIFTPDELGRVVQMKISRMNLDNNSREVLDDLIQTLKRLGNQLDVENSPNSLDALQELFKNMRK